jgi:hypothetical protein
MKKTLILSCALALAGLSTSAMAAGGQGFLRAEIGNSDIDVEVDGLGDGSLSSTSAGFGGGYWFNANVGVEGNYTLLYNDEEDGVDYDLLTLGVGIVAKKNFGANNTGFFIGGRAGVARMTAQVREDEFDVTDDESSTKPYFGVNVGYDFNENWGLSLNYDRRQGSFEGVDIDADTISLGGEWRF